VELAGNVVSAGSIKTSLGDGANSVILSAPSVRVGALSLTGGSGNDTLNANGAEVIFGALKAVLGDGNNVVLSSGNTLILGSKLSVTTGLGDDVLSFGNLVQRLGGGASLAFGDGVSIAQFNGAITFGGGVKFVGGDHATGTSKFQTGGSSIHFGGPLSATFAGGDNQVLIQTQGAGRLPAVQFQGGPGADDLLLRGFTNDFVIGPVSFKGGGGANSGVVDNTSGTVGAVTYLGGDGFDTLVVSLTAGRASAVTANLGAGPYFFSAVAQGPNRYAGPINIQAANADGQAGTIFIDSVQAGAVTMKTGDGIDTVTVTDSIFSGAFTLNTQGGDDVINIETTANERTTVFRAAVSLSLGAGADTLSIGNNTTNGRADFRSVAKFDGGADFDIAHITTAAFGNLYIDGQPLPSNFDLVD
jgi:hypothetical protein